MKFNWIIFYIGMFISGASGNIREIRGLEPSKPTLSGNELGGKEDNANDDEVGRKEANANDNEVIPDKEISPPSPFAWKIESWSGCKINEENKCGKSRSVSCIFTSTKQDIPFHFCDSEIKPKTFESCDVCKEDCIMTVWSDWSQCSATCAPASRYRTRQVVRRADHGGKECGVLSEIEDCAELEGCQVEIFVPTYTWKIQEWTSCRQMTDRNDTCELGRRFRTVSCVDNSGAEIDENLCSQSQEVSHNSPLDFKPSEEEACTLPCDCQVSSWNQWGFCSKSCHDPNIPNEKSYQTRTREVVRLPEHGGLPCPSLLEQKPCAVEGLPACPQYEWYTQEWQDCKLLLDNLPAGCGAGRQKRQVYCVQVGDEELTPVKDALCITSGAKTQRRRL